jgi:signal peptidase I
MTDRTRGRVRIRRVILDLLRTVIQVLLLFLIISALIGRFEIRQVSMEPNFHEGQRVIVSKLDSLWSNVLVGTAHAADRRDSSPFAPHRGQIVVFSAPNQEAGDPLIKRVIGVPGDTIEIHDDRVWVNNQELDEPYVNGQATACNSACSPLKLDVHSYFLMGDNRPNSLDSRSFGPVQEDRIIGRVVLRYWPIDQIEMYP